MAFGLGGIVGILWYPRHDLLLLHFLPLVLKEDVLGSFMLLWWHFLLGCIPVSCCGCDDVDEAGFGVRASTLL